MIIRGLLKTTLLDYPGHVAATIFLGGCNFRCPFCHNMDIVETGKNYYSEEEIFGFINKRKGILDGICITGGEPTLYSELPDFIRKIKETGLLVKLDTNGTNCQMLNSLIKDGLIDYVAMDIKSSMDGYETVAGIENSVGKDVLLKDVIKSIEILKNSCIDYEFRTTVVSEYHNMEVMNEIGKMIKGAKKYYLQAFTDSEYVPDHSLNAPSKEKLEEYRELLIKYVEIVEIRGL